MSDNACNNSPKQLTHTFIETADGGRVTGYDFCKWIGYDEGVIFIPSKENKNIGTTDRSGSLYYPYGIQENDVMSLYNGEYTRVQKVYKQLFVGEEEYISWVWWFISDEIDTDKTEWRGEGTSNETALSYTGLNKKRQDLID